MMLRQPVFDHGANSFGLIPEDKRMFVANNLFPFGKGFFCVGGAMYLALSFPPLKEEEILRLLGDPAGVGSPSIASLLAEEMERCRLLALPQANLVHSRLPEPLPPGAPDWLTGDCSFGFSAFALTLGSPIDGAVDRHFTQGEATRAVILDAVASAVAETLLGTILSMVNQKLRPYGQMAGPLQAPGLNAWALEEQEGLLAYLDGPALGLNCTELGQLIPKKSVTGLFPWISLGKQTIKCGNCSFKGCIYRKTSY